MRSDKNTKYIVHFKGSRRNNGITVSTKETLNMASFPEDSSSAVIEQFRHCFA